MNTTLTGLFTLECAMKIYSYGFRVGPEPRLCEGCYNMTAETQTSISFSSSFHIFFQRVFRRPYRAIVSYKHQLIPLLSLQFRGHTDDQVNMMEAFSAAFTVFFTLESLLKIAASGWRVCTPYSVVSMWNLDV